jgi:hypothetical protein
MSLAERAAALQAEACQVMESLDLEAAFPGFGPPQVIGSVLSGLMVWRDLDVMFTAPTATATEVLAGLAVIAQRPGLLAGDFRDERADRRPTPALTDERFYAVLQYEAPAGVWKVDLTIWLHAIARPHVAEATRLRAASPTQKRAILHLKHNYPGYPDAIGGTDIYTAVLDNNISTLADLQEYLANGRG